MGLGAGELALILVIRRQWEESICPLCRTWISDRIAQDGKTS